MTYKLYKLKQIIKKAGGKLVDIVFYLPKTLYEKNTSFRSFIDKRANNSYNRERKRELARSIFYYLDKYGECAVLAKYAYVGDFYFDVVNYNIDLLLEDKKWIKRNKLQITETTFYEYIKRNEPNCLFKVTNSQKEQKVYIITRKKNLK